MLSASVKSQDLAVVVSFFLKKNALRSKNILPTPPARKFHFVIYTVREKPAETKKKKVAIRGEHTRVASISDPPKFSTPPGAAPAAEAADVYFKSHSPPSVGKLVCR